MKITTPAFFLLVSALCTTTLHAGCYIDGNAAIREHPEFNPFVKPSNAAGSEEGFQQHEDNHFQGFEMGTYTGSIEGDTIALHGPSGAGFLMFGPSFDIPGSKTSAHAHITVDINWKPDQREVCTNHKTVFGKGRKCVAKGLESLPTSFVVDLSTNGGAQVHYTTQFSNVNELKDGIIDMPSLVCDGPMQSFEARIRDLNGGSVDFLIKSVLIEKAWNY